MSVYTDFRKFVNDLEASSTFTNWCSAHTADCAAWKAYRSGLLTVSPPPLPPAMSTNFGKAAVDVGLIAVQAGLVPPPVEPPLTAAFSFSKNALAVSFTDLSTPGPSGPITGWHWDFGDGSTSSSQNPSHTYAGYGNYVVALTVTGTTPDGTATVSHTVSLTNTLVADFNFSVSALVVSFTDASTPGPSGPITARAWNFGDGGTSTATNPSHTYAADGTYIVTETVTGTGADGTASVHKTVVVSSAPVTSGHCYWGARINGIVYSTYYGAPNSHYAPWAAADPAPNTWDRFEAHAGKKVCSVQWAGANQGQSFQASTAALAQGRGAFNEYDLGATAAQMASLAAGTDPGGVFTALASAMAAFGHPIILRPFWEMNGNWGGGNWQWQVNNGTPIATYVPAFKKLVQIVRAHAPNVSIFWCPNQMGIDPTPWFPGSSYCDWVGFDSYNQGANASPGTLFDATYNKVKSLAPGLPLAIGETGCKAPTSYPGGKAAWVTDFFAWMAAHPDVKWFNWFNDSTFTNNWYIEIGNAAGQTSASAMAAWAAGIADPRYIAAPAGGFPSGQKVPIPS